MSNRIQILSFVFLLSGLLVAPAAHGQKIGYTNQEAILANMPEMSEVQRTLQQAARQQQQELQQEQQELQKEMQRYQQQQSLLSDSAKAQRQRELRRQQQQLQQSSQQRQQELRQRERELMEPLLEDLQNAIDKVAQQRDVEVVLRTQALLYVDQNSSNVVDITRDVAQELGIELDQAPSEPAPTVEQPSTPATQGGGK